MEHPGELWQEYDFNGERIGNGLVPGECYKTGFKLAGGAAVMLYRVRDKEIEFLFQHRSKSLRGNPDKWDVSAGGHINVGESKLDTMVRETREEIGISLDRSKLEFSDTYIRGDILINLYFYDWTDKEDSFSFDDKEVEEVLWVKEGDLEEFWPKLKPQILEDEVFAAAMKYKIQQLKKSWK